ncbi:MAG: DUF4178 domain-containing protein [Deltaproteobacteria bacterium]|nr:DUF4178 domain-containing protein [Deltaproteobacteria bacterium]
MFLWILVTLLVLAGGTAGVGAVMYANEKRRRGLSGGPTPKELPAGDLEERTLREMRVGDIVTIDGKDFVSEGVVSYDEDGHRWVGARLVDDNDIRWCVVGLERSGAMSIRMMTQDDTAEMSGYPPEALVLGDVRYTLDKRGTATCKLDGDLGTLGRQGGKLAGTVERCRWWLYNAAGDDTAVVEQWGSDYRVLRGKKVGAGTIELMVGS